MGVNYDKFTPRNQAMEIFETVNGFRQKNSPVHSHHPSHSYLFQLCYNFHFYAVCRIINKSRQCLFA